MSEEKKKTSSGLYSKPGNTDYLYKTVEVDGNATEYVACDYVAIKKIVIQLEPPHEAMCDIVLRQFGRLNEFRVDTGFLQRFIDSQLCQTLVKSGFKQNLPLKMSLRHISTDNFTRLRTFFTGAIHWAGWRLQTVMVQT